MREGGREGGGRKGEREEGGKERGGASGGEPPVRYVKCVSRFSYNGLFKHTAPSQ